MSQLKLNISQGSVIFNFSPEAALALKAELTTLMQSLKNIAARVASGGKRPKPKPTMEYRHGGEVFLEVYCNPNIYPSPFAAKVLITVRDDRIRLTTEAELTRILEDVNHYLEQCSES
ncbi:MAG: hypothetical protein SAJ12_00020 [Jaaginema sp. PMC 1079.18]|nr:hypothetical protein [Jaaginema sp. PMC 1080.18]MEC4849369.1 hypothetical protein [Jaaginema sp. PMC 1079.18]MEC4865402.1 hypothetical protein [Jaaginema sp. PMC 1078.18]